MSDRFWKSQSPLVRSRGSVGDAAQLPYTHYASPFCAAASLEGVMSEEGHKRTFSEVCVMSALPPKADMVQHDRDVRFVPQTDILRRSKIVPFVDHLVGAQPAALAKGH